MTEFQRKICAGGEHCRQCRDRTAGATIRRQLAERFDLPSIDFACDFGGVWGRPPDRSKLPPVDRCFPLVPPGQAMPKVGPGAALHAILTRMGYQQHCGCGCAAFARQMNRWGWIACLTWRRKQITEWLLVRAAEQKIELSEDVIWQFFEAAWQELLASTRGRRGRRGQAKSAR